MRRCLRSFLVALLSLTLLGGPAHACWRTRSRHCIPVAVAHGCQPVWDDWCDPCGETVVIVESTCPPVAAGCCGEGVVVVEQGGTPGDTVATAEHDQAPVAAAEPMPADEPTAIVSSEPAGPGLEAVTRPPNLEPAGGVEQTSNEQPLPEPPPVAEEPTEASVLADESDAEPEMPKDDLPEAAASVATTPEPDVPAAADGEAEAPAPGEATEPTEEPVLPGDGVEPPMEDDPGNAPAADAEEVPPVVPAEPEPPAAPEPPPEPGNIFEEVEEAEDAEGSDGEPAEMPEVSARPSEAPADEPTPPTGGLFDEGEEPADQAADPAVPTDPFAAGDAEAAPAEEAEATTDADDAPLADAADIPATGAEDGETAAEEPVVEEPAAEEPGAEPAEQPAAEADPFAAAEQPRRWIDATGTASIVGTLVDVPADDRCLLDVGGRRIAVPLAKLSDHDRDYVRRAGLRLAKLRGGREAGETASSPAPAPTDTAGL